MEVTLIPHAKMTLGEGPIWDKQMQRLYWVDIEEKKLYHYQPDTKEMDFLSLPQKISAFALKTNQEMIIVLEDGFYELDLNNGKVELIEHVEKELEDNRFNDGKCDAKGRFFAGTMNTGDKQDQGALYCLDENLKIEQKLDGLGLSNGLAWSSDNQSMYLIDTAKDAVYQFDYDLETSSMSNQKQIINFQEEEGFPDGMTIDSEDNLWIAHYGGAKVSRWNPRTGEKLSEMKLPALNITSCTFGGKNLDELYITTARDGMDEGQLEKYPLSGRVLQVRAEVKGTESQCYISAVPLSN